MLALKHHIFTRTLFALFITILTVGLFCQAGFATEGYFSAGYGTWHKGMAGVGLALPYSAVTAANNPAGMLFVGTRYDFGIAFFNPNRDYTISGRPSGHPGTFGLTPGNVESESALFMIPSFGINWMIDDDNSFGISLFGNGGMNTDYRSSTFHGNNPTGVDLAQMFLGVTYARRVMDNHAIGVTGIIAYQRFRAQGLQAFAGFSGNAKSLTDNDHANSFGAGAKFGYMGKLSEKFSVGAFYQMKTFMSEFDEYAGLFAENGDFDIPSSFGFGVAVKITPELTFATDIKHINYSEVNAVANKMNPQNFMHGIMLGNNNGSGFGWQDVTGYKFGLNWDADNEWSFRTGYGYCEQPIPESEMLFNILAPGVVEHHLTFGLTKKLGMKEVSFALMKAFSNSISGPNAMEAPGMQHIQLKMNQWEFEIGFGF